jgi:hypothetical protein
VSGAENEGGRREGYRAEWGERSRVRREGAKPSARFDIASSGELTLVCFDLFEEASDHTQGPCRGIVFREDIDGINVDFDFGSHTSSYLMSAMPLYTTIVYGQTLTYKLPGSQPLFLPSLTSHSQARGP